MRSNVIKTDVLVIGAGVAGCSAAIALRQAGVEVVLVEKSAPGGHRFCGEFISGEALASIEQLNLSPLIATLGANQVRRVRMYSAKGEYFELPLAAQGLGLSRRAFDGALLEAAMAKGARLIERATVESLNGVPELGYRAGIRGEAGEQTIECRAVIGAHGKRSAVDRLLQREFVTQDNPHVGVKCHFQGVGRGDLVELYVFRGGYCGVVSIEDGCTNACLLATQRSLRRSGGRPEGLLEAVRRENRAFGRWMRDARAVEGSLMTVSQIPFRPKRRVVNGVFMVGDSAGVLPPFLGIGVAAALRSGRVCAGWVVRWLRGESDLGPAAAEYESWWQKQFGKAQTWGHLASRLLCRPLVAAAAIKALKLMPSVGDRVYSTTRTAPKDIWVQH